MGTSHAVAQRAMQAHEMHDAWVCRDGREPDIVEPQVSIRAASAMNAEASWFRSEWGGAPAKFALASRAWCTEAGRAA